MLDAIRPARLKRKLIAQLSTVPGHPRKRQKTRDARSIPVQSADIAISATGELDVAAFVKAREYEINALEKSIQKARRGLASRAFQQVPRAMRRRTASHNVKKVPRRLRGQAEREMKEDNTPTVTARRRAPSTKLRLRREAAKKLHVINYEREKVRQKKKQAKINAARPDPENHVSISYVPRIKKNKLAELPKAASKFKKRQVHKTWLPTHLWHAKRARMTRPSEPLWRMAIPISPTEKCYRPSHRASGGRGCIAWDVSYMSTIGCTGAEASLTGLLKSIEFHGENWSGAKFKRWQKGARSSEGWVFERDNDKEAIAPVLVVWKSQAEELGTQRGEGPGKAASVSEDAMPMDGTSGNTPQKSKPLKRQVLVRVHPSAFYRLWILLLKVSKIQKPEVLIEDLRFEIGSIEVSGPGSTEALAGVLAPVVYQEEGKTTPESVWKELTGLTNPASLPVGSLLGFNVCDPRLNHPPKQVQVPSDEAYTTRLNDLLVSWPLDASPTPHAIFSHRTRLLSAKSLLSQKAINRRKAEASKDPDQTSVPKTADPQFPILLLATRPPTTSLGAQGSWTVLLPWPCVEAVWRSLMFYPLTSGSTPRFGGLDQKRQVCLEHGEAWFPGDAPGTEAGMAWERNESEKRFDEWTRRPASRRVAWEKVELGDGRKGEPGRGWACDWEFLLKGKAEELGGGMDEAKSSDEVKESDGGNGRDDKTGDKPAPKDQMRRPVKKKPLTRRQRAEAKAKEADKASMEATFDAIMQDGAEAAVNTKTGDGASTTQDPTQTSSQPVNQLFIHYPPSLATPLFKAYLTSPPPPLPALTTIRITLQTRGTPQPCARIYRLPPSSSTTPAIRNQWLALSHQTQNTSHPNAAHRAANRVKKDPKLNHRGLPRRHEVYPDEDINHVLMIPPDAPPAYFESGEYKIMMAEYHESVAKIKAAKAKGEPAYGPVLAAEAKKGGTVDEDLTHEDRERLMQSLMVGQDEREGEAHPPCPGVEDLIGFVTTGSYNLAEGRGTAVGSVWVQRVVEGWRREVRESGRSGREAERMRRLCVVRNAGERVGRLGVWELCG